MQGVAHPQRGSIPLWNGRKGNFGGFRSTRTHPRTFSSCETDGRIELDVQAVGGIEKIWWKTHPTSPPRELKLRDGSVCERFGKKEKKELHLCGIAAFHDLKDMHETFSDRLGSLRTWNEWKKHSGRVTKWVGGLDLTYNNPPLSSLYSFFFTPMALGLYHHPVALVVCVCLSVRSGRSQ